MDHMFKLALSALLARECSRIQNTTVLQHKNESTTVAACPFQTNKFVLVRAHVYPAIQSQHSIEDIIGQDSQFKVGGGRMENRDMAPTLSDLRCSMRHRNEVMNDVESVAIDDLNPSTLTCFTMVLTCWACPGRTGTRTYGGNLTLQREVGLRVSMSQSLHWGKSSFQKETQEPVFFSSTTSMVNH